MCINLFTIKAKTYKKDSSFDAIDNIFLLKSNLAMPRRTRRIYLIFQSMFIIR